MTDLIAHLVAAVRAGAIPQPVDGEPIDDYRFRVAHAGAMVALSWLSQQHDEQVAQGATVTPLPTAEARDA